MVFVGQNDIVSFTFLFLFKSQIKNFICKIFIHPVSGSTIILHFSTISMCFIVFFLDFTDYNLTRSLTLGFWGKCLNCFNISFYKKQTNKKRVQCLHNYFDKICKIIEIQIFQHCPNVFFPL